MVMTNGTDKWLPIQVPMKSGNTPKQPNLPIPDLSSPGHANIHRQGKDGKYLTTSDLHRTVTTMSLVSFARDQYRLYGSSFFTVSFSMACSYCFKAYIIDRTLGCEKPSPGLTNNLELSSAAVEKQPACQSDEQSGTWLRNQNNRHSRDAWTSQHVTVAVQNSAIVVKVVYARKSRRNVGVSSARSQYEAETCAGIDGGSYGIADRRRQRIEIHRRKREVAVLGERKVSPDQCGIRRKIRTNNSRVATRKTVVDQIPEIIAQAPRSRVPGGEIHIKAAGGIKAWIILDQLQPEIGDRSNHRCGRKIASGEFEIHDAIACESTVVTSLDVKKERL